jgi:hypothetical protein
MQAKCKQQSNKKVFPHIRFKKFISKQASKAAVSVRKRLSPKVMALNPFCKAISISAG